MLRALRSCETMQAWPEAVLARIAQGSSLERYARGAQVLAHNPRQRTLLLVVSGSVELGGVNAAGAKFVLGHAIAGDIVNLVRLVPGLVSEYHCHTLEPAALLHVPADHLRAVLDEHPLLWRDVAMLALARQQASIVTLQRRGFRRLDQSLAQALVSLCRMQVPSARQDSSIRLRVSQADLAAMVSVSRQTINKELRQLAERGMLRVTYGELEVLEPEALQCLAQTGGAADGGA